MSKNSKPLAIVILAAGKGTRMKSPLPKVLAPLAGKPMINWLLDTAEGLKPDHIITVIGPDMKALKDAVAPHKTALQKERNGTAGALAAAMPQLKGFKGDILVLLGDTPLITLSTIKKLIKAKQASALTGLSVLGMELADPTGYGRMIQNPDGTLHHIVEHKDASAKERAVTLVNTGAFCIDGNRLTSWLSRIDNNNAQGELYITDLPYIAAQDGFATQIAVTDDPSEVLGCNTRVDQSILEATLQQRLRQKAMESGVSMIDPSSVTLHHDTKIAAGVLIEPNVFFGPDMVVKEGAHIKAFCHLEGATIGKDAIVGPFARLRPGTTLGEEVRIGNFVEVKKSKIGARSKINHLGYVGDCTMGEDVNFSAGAITVNYDGFTKHETHIGKGVIVGSNVNLIAPIAIDDGAFIAAGSTITEDVPADALSITRDVASIREGWATQYRKRKAALVKKLSKKKKAG